MTRLLPLILAVLLLPVAGSVTESRVASVAVGPSEGSSWSAPATRIGTVLIEGKASWMPAKYGSGYLAMRIPRGTRVTLCGNGGCWTTRVNDYGPSKRIHPDRIADIAVGQWERICGLDRSAGLCRITAEYGGKVREQKPNPTGPPTDHVP